jgi:hypothetical protein
LDTKLLDDGDNRFTVSDIASEEGCLSRNCLLETGAQIVDNNGLFTAI